MTPVQKITKLVQGSSLRRYFANTFWLMAEHGMRLVSGILVGVYVARYLGPDQFGSYSYALAFVALFSAISKLGLDNVLIRDLVRQPDAIKLLMGTAFWLRVVGAAVAFALIVLVESAVSGGTATTVYVTIVAIGLLFQSSEVIDFYFQSAVRAKSASIAKMVQLLISATVKLALVFVDAPLLWFVWAVVFDQLILALSLAAVAVRDKVGSFYRYFSAGAARRMLAESWPLILSGLAIMLYMRVDQLMLNQMLGSRAVGLYASAVRISEAWFAVPVLLCASVFPAIVKSREVSEALYLGRLGKLYSLVVWLSIAFALPVSLASDLLIKLLYGEAYAEAAPVLAIHVWAGIFVGLGVASSKWLVTEGLTRIAFGRTVIGAGANVALNYLLIPSYGLAGAAYATLFAQILVTYLFDLTLRRTREMFFLKSRALLWLARPKATHST